MAFNGSGVFNRLYSWVTDRNNALKIQASRMDAEMDGFATGLSNCVTKDGQTTTTAVVPFAQGIRIAASAPPSPQNGDMWADNAGVWLRMNGVSVNIQPIGMEIPWGSETPPAGWLLCYGQNVSRTTFARLFSVLGTSCGTGDGASTFGLPDYRGRTAFGKDNMGGSAANRVTIGGSGIAATALGSSGGSQMMQQHNHTQDAHGHGVSDPTHSHSVYDPGHSHQYNMVSTADGQGSDIGTSNVHAISLTAASVTGIGIYANYTGIGIAAATPAIHNNGSGSSQNMPPSLIRNWIIFAGA